MLSGDETHCLSNGFEKKLLKLLKRLVYCKVARLLSSDSFTVILATLHKDLASIEEGVEY